MKKRVQFPSIYTPRIKWSCSPNVYQFWVVKTYAEIPGEPTLNVTGEYRIPFVYAEYQQDMRRFLTEVILDAQFSLACKYCQLVRTNASKNKRAQAEFDVIKEWNEKAKAEIET